MENEINNSLLKRGVESGYYPRYLYRYMPINENTLSSLREKYLWFAKFTDFNDPYEGKVRKDHNYTTYELDSFIKSRLNILTQFEIQQLCQDADTYIDQRMREAYYGIRVCCFSKVQDNMLMWSHYADKHTGICLEFDLLEDSTNVFRSLFPVKYTNIRESCNYIRDADSYIKCFALTKSIDWSYEQEFRAIHHLLADQRFPFNAGMLKKVIFGCKANETRVQTIKDILQETVKYSQCRLNDDEYKVDIINL